MPDSIKHTSYQEQQDFLKLPPEQQNLKIYMSARETNGSVARAMQDIASLQETTTKHDKRLVKIENRQIAEAAIVAFAVVVGPVVFYALAQLWH